MSQTISLGRPGSRSLQLKLGALHVLYRADGEVKRSEIQARGWPRTRWRDDWGPLWPGDPRLAVRSDARSRTELLAEGLRHLQRLGLIAGRMPEGYRHKLYLITDRGRAWLEQDAADFERSVLTDLEGLMEQLGGDAA